jgi:hypothetical protein
LRTPSVLLTYEAAEASPNIPVAHVDRHNANRPFGFL